MSIYVDIALVSEEDASDEEENAAELDDGDSSCLEQAIQSLAKVSPSSSTEQLVATSQGTTKDNILKSVVFYENKSIQHRNKTAF